MFQDIRSIKPSLREVLPKAKSRPLAVKPPPSAPSRPRRRPRFWLWLIVVVVIAAGFWFVSVLLAAAVVTVTPQRLAIPLNETITAYKSSAAPGEAVFELITIVPISQSQTLPATLSQTVETKSTGEVLIYNNYSRANQTLLVDTRLESAAGKIYRLLARTVVPGQRDENGKLAPGSVTVKVEAVSPGPAYNSAATDFTILGFKGGPKYAKFYGRSKTPLAGGSSAVVRLVSPAARAKAAAALQATLTKQALAAARTQVPAGYLFYDRAAIIKFAEAINPAGADSASLKETVTLTAAVFDQRSLSDRLVAKRLAGDLAELDFSIINLSALELSLNQPAAFDPATVRRLSIAVKGTAEAAMTVDKTALRASLVGQTKSAATDILRQFPAIERARVDFKPPWLVRFPLAPERIIITP